MIEYGMGKLTTAGEKLHVKARPSRNSRISVIIDYYPFISVWMDPFPFKLSYVIYSNIQTIGQQVDRRETGNIFLEAAINTSEKHNAELQVCAELIEVCMVITTGTWSPTMSVQSS